MSEPAQCTTCVNTELCFLGENLYMMPANRG
jgi:hypothetical protein